MDNNLLYIVKQHDTSKLHRLKDTNHIFIPQFVFFEMIKETLEKYEKIKFSMIYEEIYLKTSMLGTDIYEYIDSVYFIPTNSGLILELDVILGQRYKTLSLNNENDIIIFNLNKPFSLSQNYITNLEYLPNKYDYLIKELNSKITIIEDA